MSAAQEATILPKRAWVSQMAGMSIRVSAAKAALQTMPAGTATGREENTHSSLSCSQEKNKVQCSETAPKHSIQAGTITSLVCHLARRQPAMPAAPACSPSALCCQCPGTGLEEGDSPQLCLPGFSVPVTSSSSVSLDHEYVVLVVCEDLLYTRAAV